MAVDIVLPHMGWKKMAESKWLSEYALKRFLWVHSLHVHMPEIEKKTSCKVVEPYFMKFEQFFTGRICLIA